MTRIQLTEQIFLKKSFLCIGLDTDIDKIPSHLKNDPDPVFAFNKAIIDATKDFCVSYKINTAFYEALGVKGWASLEKTVNYIPGSHFKIADAKRGDIGNTSSQYAKAFFETIPFDAITVAPYMGKDSVSPFLKTEGKWAIILGLTSNSGAFDFELQEVIVGSQPRPYGDLQNALPGSKQYLYESVLMTASDWGNTDNTMFVIGATRPEQFANIRRLTPDHFYLVPGVGFQGGSLQEISEHAMIKDCGLLVNVSRAIIYAGHMENFAEEAASIAHQYQSEMSAYLPS